MRYESPDFCLEEEKSDEEKRRQLAKACQMLSDGLPSGYKLEFVDIDYRTYSPDGQISYIALTIPDQVKSDSDPRI